MSTESYKNIILVGATGSIGSVLLKGLTSEPQFTVTVLARESSKSITSLPSKVKLVKIADSYPYEDLVAAFKGQDAVVMALSGGQISEQFRFIDAAVEAGVKRYVPSEYGLNNMDPRAQGLNAVFNTKGKIRRYLMDKAESTSLTWTAIANGMWIDWSIKSDFLGLDAKNKHITYIDDGNSYFSASTMENTARTLNHALLKPAESNNKAIFISNFAVSQREIVAAIERISGEKWTFSSVDSAQMIPEYQKRFAEGDIMAVYKLIEIGFVSGKFSGYFEKEGYPLANKSLGLPDATLDEVVTAGLAGLN
jgi:nucleoside-diphosphate-sugar epimerase